VNPSLNRAKRPDAEAVAGLAQHLGVFAGTLSPRERALLAAAVRGAMLPLDRMMERDPGELLSGEEQALLGDLVAADESTAAS
jgi:hypothetical protein